MRNATLFVIFLMGYAGAYAQDTVQTVQSYKDSIAIELYSDSIELGRCVEDDSNYVEEPLNINPQFYKLYLPLTYYSEAVKQYAPSFDIGKGLPDLSVDTVEIYYPKSKSLYEVPKIAAEDESIDKFINEHLFRLYAEKPTLIRKWDFEIEKLVIYNPSEEELVKPKTGLAAILSPDPEIAAPVINTPTAELIKPSFWKPGTGNGSLNISQLHLSDNWYKGGENNLNVQANALWRKNYDSRKGFTWDNSAAWKVGFTTAQSDTIHSIKMNTDMFRYTGKFGLRSMVKNWTYSLSTQFTTQFFNTYNTNDPLRTRTSSFLTPSYVSIGLGMEYKLSKKKTNLSVVIAALNHDLRFVADQSVDERRFGIREGLSVLCSNGSKITSTFDWSITSYIKYAARFEGFTTYARTEGSLENTLTFNINRYFSTSFFLHIRFDDNTQRQDDKYGYFQYKDTFNFGLSYNW